MTTPRKSQRFLFRGSAVAFGGLMWDPPDVLLPSRAAVCLPIVGGRSDSEKETQVKPLVAPGTTDEKKSPYEISFSEAKSWAEGSYVGGGRTSPTVTTVHTEIHGLNVLIRDLGTRVAHTVEIGTVSATMESHHDRKEDKQTTITTKDLRIEGLVIDDQEIVRQMKFVDEILEKKDYWDLANAYHKNLHGFKTKHEDKFKEPPVPKEKAKDRDDDKPKDKYKDKDGFKIPPAEKCISFCTIADLGLLAGLPDGVTQAGPSEIEIDNFGTLAFGELFVYTHERRLSMVHFKLGSPTKGDGSVGDLSTDGNGWPP